MNFVIRADGSTEMGYGHLVRSNTIAESLLNTGSSVTYLTNTPKAVSDVCSDHARIVRVKGDTRGRMISQVSDIAPNGVLVDLPEVPFELQRDLREVCNPLAVILGSARHQLCCDVLINGHFFAEEEPYEWHGSEPGWCLGPKYLPLRKPFPEFANREIEPSDDPDQALILMGGTDPHNITPTMMRAFEPLDLNVTVVVGPGNENQAAIEDTRDALGGSFEITRDPDDLPARMFHADIAVTGFGTTTYELMATRTPFIGVTRTDLEQETACKISSYVDIETFDRDISPERLSRALREIIQNTKRRSEIRNRFRTLVDGRGAERICRKLRSLSDSV